VFAHRDFILITSAIGVLAAQPAFALSNQAEQIDTDSSISSLSDETQTLTKNGAIYLTASALFKVADQELQSGHTAAAITIYRALERDANISVRSEARFRHGQLLANRHKFAEAATLYRAILDEQPQAQRVRLELAAVLTSIGDLRGARGQLRQAQAGGLPPEVAQVVNQYVAALRSFKPWGGSFELALTPDSNINRATDGKTLDTVIAPLDLSRDARQRSGLGLKPSGQLYVRANLSKDLTLVPRISGQGTFYRQNQFNDVSGSAQLGLEWRLKSDRFTPSAGYTWRWYGGDLYARTRSFSIDWLHPAGKRGQFDTNLGISRARYVRNGLQDGVIYNGSVSYERALTARSGASVSLSANRQTARDPGYATASGAFGLVYWHDMGKFTVFGTATLSRLEADKRLSLFPERRREWYVRGGLGSIFRQVQVAGFSPVVRVTYERNWSTVGIYDFKRLVTDVGITRAF
jgi:outer membrane protein